LEFKYKQSKLSFKYTVPDQPTHLLGTIDQLTTQGSYTFID